MVVRTAWHRFWKVFTIVCTLLFVLSVAGYTNLSYVTTHPAAMTAYDRANSSLLPAALPMAQLCEVFFAACAVFGAFLWFICWLGFRERRRVFARIDRAEMLRVADLGQGDRRRG